MCQRCIYNHLTAEANFYCQSWDINMHVLCLVFPHILSVPFWASTSFAVSLTHTFIRVGLAPWGAVIPGPQWPANTGLLYLMLSCLTSWCGPLDLLLAHDLLMCALLTSWCVPPQPDVGPYDLLMWASFHRMPWLGLLNLLSGFSANHLWLG